MSNEKETCSSKASMFEREISCQLTAEPKHYVHVAFIEGDGGGYGIRLNWNDFAFDSEVLINNGVG